MNVPLLDLKAQHEPLRKDLLAAMERVLDQNNFILGREVKELESQVAAYSQTRFAVGVSSGTDALLAALMALDVKAGDEVITTPLSFFATVGAIVRLGATPVFVDTDPVTYNLDPNRIEAAVTIRELPYQLFGFSSKKPHNCNAGWLATCGHGTALAPVYAAHAAGLVQQRREGRLRDRHRLRRLVLAEVRPQQVVPRASRLPERRLRREFHQGVHVELQRRGEERERERESRRAPMDPDMSRRRDRQTLQAGSGCRGRP